MPQTKSWETKDEDAGEPAPGFGRDNGALIDIKSELVNAIISQPNPATQSNPATQNEIFKHSTISEDQSAGSDLPSRLLLAIAQTKNANQLLRRLTLQEKISKLSEESVRVSAQIPDLRNQSNIWTKARANEPEIVRASSQDTMPDPRNQSNLWAEAGTDEPGSVRASSQDNMPAKKIAEALNNENPSTQVVAELCEYIANLEGKVQQLEKLQQANVPKRCQVLYHIKRSEESAVYLDHPEWAQGDSTIKSCRPLHNLDLYLERNKDISFLVHRIFYDKGRGVHQMVEYDTPSDCIKFEDLDSPTPQREWIEPIARDLRETLHTILQSRPEYTSLLGEYKKSRVISAPYLFMYHGRSHWEKVLARFSSRAQQQLKQFADYVFRYYGEKYAAAKEFFSQGKVTPAFMKYLFVPGELLLSRKNGDHQGYMSTSWPRLSYRLVDGRNKSSDDTVQNHTRHFTVESRPTSGIASVSYIHSSDYDHEVQRQGEKQGRESAVRQEAPDSCSVNTWRWGFDTKFKKQYETLSIEFPRSKSEESFHTRPIRVDELGVFPMRFASEAVIKQLKHRGKMLWQCRERYLVSYVEEQGEVADDRSDERYMIDQKTFQVLNPHNFEFKLPPPLSPGDELTPDQIDRDDMPDENFQYLLPLTIKGYNLRRKKWHDVAVDRISPVVWNKRVFETLVMDRKPKDLIQALISKQVASQKSTDLIVGKGNGLILLLHGGPGTGKTLTAESVAEIAEKPLYRVTCGDVGTKAEDVEKYLESVLHLGKIWDCVVLLDEADVFLEQRSLEDLQRNALVSVFLRILEYHEGILILTSNRVGIFDEAFRSRIQLALHYPSLRPYQRQQIWQNFFKRLDSFKDDMVDVGDLQDHLEDLAKFEMNGRQIRNVITTARQYSEWKGNKLDYECLKDVIEVSGKFDTYLTKLRGGYTSDQIAEDDGLR